MNAVSSLDVPQREYATKATQTDAMPKKIDVATQTTLTLLSIKRDVATQTIQDLFPLDTPLKRKLFNEWRNKAKKRKTYDCRRRYPDKL